jgi:uncharacterized protein (TIGR02217 family)
VDAAPTDAFTVDYTTGLVTLAAASGAVLTADLLFEVPVRFAQDAIDVRRVASDAYSLESIKLVELLGHESTE